LPADRSPLFPAEASQTTYRVHVCRGPNCSARGSAATLTCFEQAVQDAGLGDKVEILATSCRDRCDWGPSVNVYPGPTLYAQIDCAAARTIVSEHLQNGQPVERLKFDSRRPGRKR